MSYTNSKRCRSADRRTHLRLAQLVPRLSKDYELLHTSAETIIHIAFATCSYVAPLSSDLRTLQ